MPVVFKLQGIRFHFYSNEGNPPVVPDVRMAESVGYSRREQANLLRLVEQRRDEIVRAWDEHFGDGTSL